MSGKRVRKTPDRYISWEKGEKHAPMAIRKQKKKQEEVKQKQKEYQKLYREQKKYEKKTMPMKEAAK